MVHQNSEIASALLRINAIKLNPTDPFTWASGIISPIYCDNRIALSHPAVRKLIIEKFVESSKSFESIEMIAGVATAGIPWGAYLAEALDLPFIYVRSKPKAHGRKNKIEGEIIPNANILVVEDLISTGGSSIEAVKAIRDEGSNVLGVLAIFEYEFEKAQENFKSADCNYKTLANYSQLLRSAEGLNLITGQQKDILIKWRNNPENWWHEANNEVNK